MAPPFCGSESVAYVDKAQSQQVDGSDCFISKLGPLELGLTGSFLFSRLLEGRFFATI